MRLKAHPRYAVYKAWFRSEARRATRLEAELYRVAGPRHTTASELLAGVGAFKGGGRWNPPRVMRVIYLSFAPETAMREANEHSRYHRIPMSKGMPKVTVAVRVVVEAVLDLTKAGAFPEPMANLMAEDWRAVMARMDESTTQAVGRAACAAGLQGLVVPSKPDPGGTNVLIFPENLTILSAMAVLNPELLKKLGKPS
jgi:RES domain-containing protein